MCEAYKDEEYVKQRLKSIAADEEISDYIDQSVNDIGDDDSVEEDLL